MHDLTSPLTVDLTSSPNHAPNPSQNIDMTYPLTHNPTLTLTSSPTLSPIYFQNIDPKYPLNITLISSLTFSLAMTFSLTITPYYSTLTPAYSPNLSLT